MATTVHSNYNNKSRLAPITTKAPSPEGSTHIHVLKSPSFKTQPISNTLRRHASNQVDRRMSWKESWSGHGAFISQRNLPGRLIINVTIGCVSDARRRLQL